MSEDKTYETLAVLIAEASFRTALDLGRESEQRGGQEDEEATLLRQGAP